MIVQPIIGHYSDQTWTRLGRRRPYFLTGAVLASLMLFLMPNSPALAPLLSPLLIGAGILMIMDASINVAMEPFRALVADNLPSEQRTLGFSMQTALIGVGAVAGAILPFALAAWFGVSNVPETEGGVADNVKYAFYAGAAVLFCCVCWTVFRTREYPPERGREEAGRSAFFDIFRDFGRMPATMRQLGLVQFFSWFALFSMWVYMVPAVADHCYGTTDRMSADYGNAGDWVGVLQGIYNGVAAVYAFLLPSIARKIGRKATHALSLLLGSAGFLSFLLVRDPHWLVVPMVGIGIAWGSILAMPYAMLAGCIPASKMGVYMGIFNFFITVPQICNGLLGGAMVRYLYGGQTVYALAFSGICLAVAALLSLRVEDRDDPVQLRPGRNGDKQ